ncbi:SDR family oxidoreductase [Variovorax robiniae]|uniref:SDR family oxidoreductase n=1 Tax=Variovorax robiniae TaxID=1836199 RepID=A0ABU8XLA1_9BURK
MRAGPGARPHSRFLRLTPSTCLALAMCFGRPSLFPGSLGHRSSISPRLNCACAAKAGSDQLTRVLALEWGSAGVRLNSISQATRSGSRLAAACL